MSKTLILVQTYPGGHQTILDHWHFYERAGVDIAIVDTFDSNRNWGGRSFRCGNDTHRAPSELHLKRMIGTFKEALRLYPEYNDYCLIQDDSVFMGRLPGYPGGFAAQYCGNCLEAGWKDYKADHNWYHCPWWGDKETLESVVECGTLELLQGNFTNKSPDIWIGMVLAKYKIPVTHLKGVWTCNGGDFTHPKKHNLNQIAADAITKGCWYLHGLRGPNVFKGRLGELLKQ